MLSDKKIMLPGIDHSWTPCSTGVESKKRILDILYTYAVGTKAPVKAYTNDLIPIWNKKDTYCTCSIGMTTKIEKSTDIALVSTQTNWLSFKSSNRSISPAIVQRGKKFKEMKFPFRGISNRGFSCDVIPCKFCKSSSSRPPYWCPYWCPLRTSRYW